MSDLIDLDKLQRDAARLVEAARKAGADACDVVVAHGQTLGVNVREGKVENTGRSEADDVSLRVFCGKRVASVSANSLEAINELASRAVAMARVSPEDKYQGLAPADRLATEFPDLDLFDEFEPDTDFLTAKAMAAEEAGIAVEGVSKSMGTGAGWGVTGFVLATSEGFAGNYRASRHTVSASMVSGEGTEMERDYDFHSAAHPEDLKSPEEIGSSAAVRVVRRRNPRQCDSGAMPVIYDRRVATGLLGGLLGAVNGASVARKTSFLRECMHQLVANPAITVIDDPLRPRGLGSHPFDGEGMPSAPLEIVTQGHLNCWLLDWAAARELGLESNGRASRGGAGTSPSPSNCHIEAGSTSVDDMIAGLEKGLLLTETIGHGVNMVTGDYSKGASGFMIENGEVTFPVSEITIAGNLKEMFKTMLPASDLEFRGSVNAPSLLVEGMTVGGK